MRIASDVLLVPSVICEAMCKQGDEDVLGNIDWRRTGSILGKDDQNVYRVLLHASIPRHS